MDDVTTRPTEDDLDALELLQEDDRLDPTEALFVENLSIDLVDNEGTGKDTVWNLEQSDEFDTLTAKYKP